jgi:CRISPR-associated endoribonuclease Cas6
MKLDNPLPANAGYPLYAALLAHSSEYFSDLVHTDSITPLSQSVSGDQWRVCLLTEEAEQEMIPVLENLDTLNLGKLDKTVRITQRTVQTIWSAEDLFYTKTPDKLIFKTPTAFKSGKFYQLLPTQRLLLQSLIQKWNSCFGESHPIAVSESLLDALSQELAYRSVHLESIGYSIKNTTIPGTLGTVRIKMAPEGFHHQLICALLHFGCFSGVGIKAALGMGGFMLE